MTISSHNSGECLAYFRQHCRQFFRSNPFVSNDVQINIFLWFSLNYKARNFMSSNLDCVRHMHSYLQANCMAVCCCCCCFGFCSTFGLNISNTLIYLFERPMVQKNESFLLKYLFRYLFMRSTTMTNATTTTTQRRRKPNAQIKIEFEYRVFFYTV